MGEFGLSSLQPKQAAMNSLTSVIFLGFHTSYDNVAPHLKQYFEQHDYAYLLTSFSERSTSVVLTAVCALEPGKNICLFKLIN